jgi:hypothetical protein
MADLLAAALAAADPAARATTSAAFAAAVAKDAKVLKATGAVEALKAALEGTDGAKREAALSAERRQAFRSCCVGHRSSVVPLRVRTPHTRALPTCTHAPSELERGQHAGGVLGGPREGVA